GLDGSYNAAHGPPRTGGPRTTGPPRTASGVSMVADRFPSDGAVERSYEMRWRRISGASALSENQTNATAVMPALIVRSSAGPGRAPRRLIRAARLVPS